MAHNTVTLVTHVSPQLRNAVGKAAKANDRSITAELRNTLQRIYAAPTQTTQQAGGHNANA